MGAQGEDGGRLMTATNEGMTWDTREQKKEGSLLNGFEGNISRPTMAVWIAHLWNYEKKNFLILSHPAVVFDFGNTHYSEGYSPSRSHYPVAFCISDKSASLFEELSEIQI